MTYDIFKFRAAVDELVEFGEQTFRLFLEATYGWMGLRRELTATVNLQVSQGRSEQLALDHPLLYLGEDGPPSEKTVPAHRSTFRKTLGHCAPKGPNEVFQGNMCVVAIYSFWETVTRKKIGNALGCEQGRVLSNLMGDLKDVFRFGAVQSNEGH